MSKKRKCPFYCFDKVLGLGACSKTGLFCSDKDCPFRIKLGGFND